MQNFNFKPRRKATKSIMFGNICMFRGVLRVRGDILIDVKFIFDEAFFKTKSLNFLSLFDKILPFQAFASIFKPEYRPLAPPLSLIIFINSQYIKIFNFLLTHN